MLAPTVLAGGVRQKHYDPTGIRHPGRAVGSRFRSSGDEGHIRYFPSPPGRSGTFGMAISPLPENIGLTVRLNVLRSGLSL